MTLIPGQNLAANPLKPKTLLPKAQSAREKPVDTLDQAGQQLTSDLEGRSLHELRKLAGVKKKGFLGRAAQTVGSWITGVKLALAVGPTLGHTIVAKHLSDLESAITGKPALAPLDYLRERRPEAYVDSLATLLAAASDPAEQSQGLSPTDLLDAEQHFYQAMQPVTGQNGFKSTAPYLQELAKEPFRTQKEERAAFVFLGEKQQDDADSITQLWNSPDRPATNPFPKDDQRGLVWDRLEVEAGRGLLPVFVDVDGDYGTFTGTEFVAKRTLASLGERNNSLGDGFTESGVYFAWLTTRLESTSQELLPYLASKDKKLAQQVDQFKETLTPPWLHGKDGIGPWPALEDVREIPNSLAKIKEKKGEGPWVDTLTSLDRDLLTGVQTHWIKLLRELPREGRQGLTKQLSEALFSWNLQEPGTPGFDLVSPQDAPMLTELSGRQDNLQKQQRPYDRSVALKEIADHTLDGLGIAERREMLEAIKANAEEEVPRLQARETRLLAALGNDYSGLDISKVLDGSLPKAELKEGLRALREFADKSPRDPLAHEARRHGQLLNFLYEMDHRYGELDEVITKLAGDFEKNPLGVSEFFIPPAKGATVSPVAKVVPTPVRMGNPNDPNPMKVSQIFEGGGGRGFAYVECLKQFESAFANSPNGYEIDEFIGTSAGSMMAVLLAAGYKPDELRTLLEALDFTSFNGDAVWMMGGVDPKVRGIERNGLFSTQKMYQTFSKLLSDKLGIEGRPILFADLPHKLKMITTLVNTDMAAENPLRENLDGDGRMTWSSDGTPNVDVVGVLIASASVPGFFQSPQILVHHLGENGETKRSRLQMQDGGVVDNLSISSATDDGERALVVLPSHTRTRHPETGEWIGLDTLNFDTGNLDLVDAHNRELYGKFMPQMDEYLQRMKEHGAQRAVVGFNLARETQQSLPALQGSSESLSLKGLIHAKELGLPVMSKDKGDKLISFTQRPPGALTNVLGDFFDKYIDNRPGEGDGKGKLYRDADGFHFRVGAHEESDLFEAVRSTGAAALSASASEYAERKFEREGI